MINILHYWETLIWHPFVKELINEQSKYDKVNIISIWNNKEININKIWNYTQIEWYFNFDYIFNLIKIYNINILHIHISIHDENLSNLLKKINKLWVMIFFNSHWWYWDYIELKKHWLDKIITWFIAQHKSIKTNLDNDLNLVNSNIFSFNLTTVRRKHLKVFNEEKISFWYIWRVDDIRKWIWILSEVLLKLEKESLNFDFHFFTFKLWVNEKKIMDDIKIFERKNINFYYDLQDKEFIFSKIDLLIIPSYRYETWPMVLYEALSTKTPCMVSDNWDMKNVITNGKDWLVFKQKNVESLYESMKSILEWKYYINELINNIDYNYFIDEFCIDLFKLYWIIDYGKKI